MKTVFLAVAVLSGWLLLSSEEKKAVPDGLFAYYSFNNDSKECLKDSISGLNIVPRKNLPSSRFQPGISGNALELLENSTGQYICRDPRLTKLAPPFTISVWIKRYNTQIHNSIIVATASDQSPQGFELVWSWRYLVFRMGIGKGKKPFAIKSAEQILSFDAWINIAVSCDLHHASLFVDGKKVAEGKLPADVNFVPSDGIGTAFTIGHFPTPLPVYKHVGLIDELRIYKRALTDVEIGQVMFLAQE